MVGVTPGGLSPRPLWASSGEDLGGSCAFWGACQIDKHALQKRVLAASGTRQSRGRRGLLVSRAGGPGRKPAGRLVEGACCM